MLFERILRAFHEQKLQYVVIGGVAVNLHGYARATGDLDVVVSFDDAEIQKFIGVVKSLNFVPRVPVKIEDFADAKKRDEWICHKNMKVFSVYNPKNPMEHIDVMVDHVVDFATLFKNRVVMHYGNIAVSVAGIADLITLKKHAGRGRDQTDIIALEAISRLKDEE